MDRHDQELLDKQLRHIEFAPRNDGVAMLLSAMFFAGMAIGGFLYAYAGSPPHAVVDQTTQNQRIASNEVPIFVPQGRITPQ
jgi:hypothetical protein